MAPSFYRYLYQEVGKPHHWFIRRNLPDGQLSGILTSGKAEIWVLYVDGCPAGFYEIDIASVPDNADIQYFGLLPEYQGRGLSKFYPAPADFLAPRRKGHRKGAVLERLLCDFLGVLARDIHEGASTRCNSPARHSSSQLA